MKWLILLALVLLLFGFIAFRYRRQIRTAIEVWRMFKQFKQGIPQPKNESNPKIAKEKNENLVRCSNCGNWIAESTALNLRSKMFYCSTQCVEKSVIAK
jgi:Sec-independent protein translocase protein TatA